jgi:hypothetical protein
MHTNNMRCDENSMKKLIKGVKLGVMIQGCELQLRDDVSGYAESVETMQTLVRMGN